VTKLVKELAKRKGNIHKNKYQNKTRKKSVTEADGFLVGAAEG
jgi:hypothetical protein